MHVIRQTIVLALALTAVACSSATGPDAPAVEITAVVVDPAASTLLVGAALPLQAQVQDASGALLAPPAVTWTVRDPGIASVSPAGVVTALTPGTTQIAANVSGRSGIATITVQRVPVASVTVRPSRVELLAGGRAQLTATAYDAAQNSLGDRAVTWSSSNALVATVDAAGMVTAVARGTAVVTGTSEGKSEGATVVVNDGPVASVAVTPSPLAMTAGQTTQLAVTTRDASGAAVSGRAVAWTTTNSSVATVNASGLVTAVGPGTAVLTATSEGVSGSTTVTVTAPAAPPTPVAPVAPVAAVTITPAGVTIAPNEQATLTATPRSASGTALSGRTVTWISSDTRVATVSGNGVVTGVANGTVIITATSEGRSATATVVVRPGPATSVTVTPAIASVREDRTLQLTATARDRFGNVITGRAFTWRSSNTTFATVNSSGLVEGERIGTVTITATLDAAVGQSAVTVTP